MRFDRQYSTSSVEAQGRLKMFLVLLFRIIKGNARRVLNDAERLGVVGNLCKSNEMRLGKKQLYYEQCWGRGYDIKKSDSLINLSN